MNRFLWIGQLLLAIFFVLAGYVHGIMPLDRAAQWAPWVTSLPAALVRFIGRAELAGALGLLLPPVIGVAHFLVPLAAVGLMLIMALATAFHLMRGESHIVGMHIAVALLALFVAGGRLTPAPRGRAKDKRPGFS